MAREQAKASEGSRDDSLGAEGLGVRVVSLLPSATEMVWALGAGDRLLGVSHECDFPEAARALPSLTRSRIDPQASSLSIDRAVRRALEHEPEEPEPPHALKGAEAVSIYAIDSELLAELKPDLVITQDLCEVCAVSLDDVQAAVARLAHRADMQVLALSPTRLSEVLGDVRRVAAALGLTERGAELRRQLEARIESVRLRAAQAGPNPHPQARKPRVVSVEWLEPLMLGGTWMPELIEACGGEAVGARAGEPAPTLDRGELAALKPDVVLIKPCGFPIERSLEERSVIARQVLAAAPDARVYLSDGNQFFNRPGPRLVESLEILAACVLPEVFADFAEKHAAVLRRLA